MKRCWQTGLALLLGVCCSQAAETARLNNGFSLRCERHEQVGDLTRLYLDANSAGFLDMPTAQISSFEAALEEPAKNEAVPRDRATIHDHIARAGARTGIDPDFLESVIRAESGYNPGAVSPKGARGLMQLMPATAAKLGVDNSLDAEANIDGGSRYLRELLLRYNGDAIKALAAYNSGPERVEQYKGVPPYRETRNYVARVIDDFNRRKLSSPAATSTPAAVPATVKKTRKPPPAKQLSTNKTKAKDGPLTSANRVQPSQAR